MQSLLRHRVAHLAIGALVAVVILGAFGVLFTDHALAKGGMGTGGGTSLPYTPPPAASAYYLALGDSLAFGYQPNGDYAHGYAQDIAPLANLKLNHAHLVNFGCPGESAVTMTFLYCFARGFFPIPYSGAQLAAAVSFLNNNHGKVPLVTLDIGANDVLPYINPYTCSINSYVTNAIHNVQGLLTYYILPELKNAMVDQHGHPYGKLMIMNYYDPLALNCPDSLPVSQQLNTAIQTAAAAVGVPVANVYAGFGGVRQASTLCLFTWICSPYHDIHANITGYRLIAGAFTAAGAVNP